MTAPRSSSPARLGLLAAGLASLAACTDATAPSPAEESARPAATVSVAPELVAAIADADGRVVPALDAATRAGMHAALVELRSALAAGDAVGGRRALASVRAILAGHAADSEDDGDGADLAAVALIADAAAQAVDADAR